MGSATLGPQTPRGSFSFCTRCPAIEVLIAFYWLLGEVRRCLGLSCPLRTRQLLFLVKFQKTSSSHHPNPHPIFSGDGGAVTCWAKKTVKCSAAFSLSSSRHVAPKFPGCPATGTEHCLPDRLCPPDSSPRAAPWPVYLARCGELYELFYLQTCSETWGLRTSLIHLDPCTLGPAAVFVRS